MTQIQSQLIDSSQLMGKKLYTAADLKHKLGKISQALCSSDGLYVQGFIVKRPDLALMIKRPDEFVALDALVVDGGLAYVKQMDGALGKKAIQRLNLDWDSCIIWQGMELKTKSGERLGFVLSLEYEQDSGKIVNFVVDEGLGSAALLGSCKIPLSYAIGLKDHSLIVRDEAANIKAQGGLAAQAGKASAKAALQVHDLQKKSAQTLGQLNETASYSLGKQLKKTKGMFAAFKEEYKKSSQDDK